ncbi:MAG: threonine/serine ThrE exporter family protein [Sciscionella sp.]
MRLRPRARVSLEKLRERANAHAETRNLNPIPLPNPITGFVPDVPYGPALPNENVVYLAMELALRIGEVLMSSGAGAADATATIIAVTSAYGLPTCEVDVIFTSISVCCHRGTELAPITTQRVVRNRGLDYTRLLGVEDLVRRITRGKVRIYDALGELDKITNAPHPYPRWTATAAWAGLAASIALLIGGNALVASIAAIITALVDRIGRVLNRYGLPAFFQQVVGGALATAGALVVVYTGLFSDAANLQPALVIGAAITVLLSGLSVVSTVQDAITGYNVTAAGRSVEIGLTSAGLIAGVVLALNIAVAVFGLPKLQPVPSVSLQLLSISALTGAAAAGFFALASYATVRTILVASLAGALGAAVYRSLQLAGLGPITSAGVAAAVVGFAGGTLARRLRIPPVILAVSGLTPLLPGLSTYRALYDLAVTHSSRGLAELTTAIAIALALGAGVVLGEYLAQPVRTGLGRLERRFAGPRLAGPLRASERRLD